MADDLDRRPLGRYLVELYAPEAGWRDLGQLSLRARATAAKLRGKGGPVRFLRTIYVPEDGSCFLLYEGPSAAVVAEAAREARLAVAGITAAVAADEVVETHVQGGTHGQALSTSTHGGAA